MTTRFIDQTAALAVAAAVAAAFSTAAAQAHVTVQPRTAAPGSPATLRFVVGHGCDGQPTTGLRVVVPAGVEQVQPLPKAGWSVSRRTTETGRLELVWSGGAFAPHEADGFEVQARLPARPGALAFEAFQSCGATVVGWIEPARTDGAKPTHPAPILTLAAEAAVPPAAGLSAAPQGVSVRDGDLIDPGGLPLYTFDFDTMVGMSHCVGACVTTWRPFKAPAGARPVGDFTLVGRDDGSVQWAYRTKPLYTYAKDVAGGRAAGAAQDNWRPAAAAARSGE